MKWMMTIIVSYIWSTSFGGEEYRDFTDQQGRTIKAKLVSFDSKSGKVTIERDNQREATVPQSIFSNEDQNYINRWVKNFLLSDKKSCSYSIDEIKGELSDYPTVLVKYKCQRFY